MNPIVKNALFFLCGIVTTALSMGLASAILDGTDGDFNIMGFYLVFIIPIGAIGMGMLAAVGYGVSARYLGVKITAGHIAAIVALHMIAYLGVQYAEYVSVQEMLKQKIPGFGPEMVKALALTDPEAAAKLSHITSGFWSYFDFSSRAFSFDGGEGMGAFGYAFRLLEIGGFLGGSWITASIAGNKPFCDDCQVYYEERVVGYTPFMQDEDARYLTQMDEAFTEHSHAKLGGLLQEPEFTAADPNLPNRIQLQHWSCPECNKGWFQANQIYVEGDSTSNIEVERWETTPEFNGEFKKF